MSREYMDSFEARINDRVAGRAEFITKTYLHLLGAILAFLVIEVALFMSGAADAIVNLILPLGQIGWLAVLGAFMIVSWIASHTAHSAESRSSQYLALGAYVLGQALIFVPLLWIADRYAKGAIEAGALTTVIGFTGLTAVAFITKQDFSFLRGVVYWGLMCGLILIVAGAIFGFQLGTFFIVAMIAVAGAAILYDTSNVLHHYPEDRYVGAALELFSSFALLLWYMIRLFMRRN